MSTQTRPRHTDHRFPWFTLAYAIVDTLMAILFANLLAVSIPGGKFLPIAAELTLGALFTLMAAAKYASLFKES